MLISLQERELCLLWSRNPWLYFLLWYVQTFETITQLTSNVDNESYKLYFLHQQSAADNDIAMTGLQWKRIASFLILCFGPSVNTSNLSSIFTFQTYWILWISWNRSDATFTHQHADNSLYRDVLLSMVFLTKFSIFSTFKGYNTPKSSCFRVEQS